MGVRTVGIGNQDFETIRKKDCFYIDKTGFIKEWWENMDTVTLIARPRRFGKTLTMNMTEKFFSVRYAGRGDLFEGLRIWDSEKFRKLQGTYPVISLSFANIKETDYGTARRKICQTLSNLYLEYEYLLDSDAMSERERSFFESVSENMDDTAATMAIHQLSLILSKYYGEKVIILLDEYDTPMQEAYVNGYWGELMPFIRNLFNASFKTNPFLERALMTGITRVSRESIFSDLNNLTVVTTGSELYADSFGFTQQEVWKALDEYGLREKREEVRDWYDGFTFGQRKDIYNPWSILNYLKFRKFSAYWANTSSNSLVDQLIRGGNADVKIIFEELLAGRTFRAEIDEQIVFSQLDGHTDAIWSLLLASGYLRLETYRMDEKTGTDEYELALTNKEVRIMFKKMIEGWFAKSTPAYNQFIKAFLAGDKKAMNQYINRVALVTFSYFDTGKHPSKETEPERFYHGFVLGLMVELADRYVITSNRESGFGRYDVILEPREKNLDAFILEFKVFDPDEEDTLEDTVKEALNQIECKQCAASLREKGISPKRIRTYGFAFEGKKVLIG